MSLARDVVDLSDRIASDSEGPDVFASRPDLARYPEAAAMMVRLASVAPDGPEPLLQLLLQALRIQRSTLEPRLIDAAFVATFPGEIPIGALPTKQAIRDMLRAPASEIVALGYELSHEEIIDMLCVQSKQGADVTLICDRQRGRVDELRERWSGRGEPRIYCNQGRDGAAPYAKMHCKALLVDGRDLLISSANFTFHGLEGNIEFGVRLRGEPAVGARRVFEHMIRCGLVVLE